ncbi:class I SAM-dependent methyltransferase [Planococcus shenhongbingii]|uniref:Class I SAM-dependent methyltransferase n=1 Tax=Planococcus shenhongbingii TaxID=3058398 RepID=A0ABT8NBR8_9BACL|nr:MULTISPECIES: class I SAM-dependent methyltransferase [unclassified Planococcus (in: firmicutes)]MDN7245338.1 class I SAM-dependent methyltransferase [Planococcus sp. N017]WKA58443.1 class I SAM-dependent methyltransferase [Planococcus sp. N016]
MTEQEFYDKVGKTNGWDFSSIQCLSEGIGWDFYEEVVKRASVSDILLDIGTGGGEKVLDIASSFSLVIGIDNSKEMVQTARANLVKSSAQNVRFFQQPAEDLQFPNGFFDIASSRHCSFDSSQVAKVLKKGGWFLTQQVSEGDKSNLKQAFGRGQCFGEQDGTLKENCIKELQTAGFSKVEAYDYNSDEYFRTPEDLIFLLTHTPIIPDFGEQEGDLESLNAFIENNRTEKGIRTNSKRFLVIAKR